MVSRKRVTTRRLAATLIRSCTRMIFETAAAISGVMPRVSAVSVSPSALFRKKELAELTDGKMRDGRECLRVVGVADEPRYFVRLIRDKRLGQESLQRHVGQQHLRPRALFGAGCRKPRKLIARPRRARRGQERSEIHRLVLDAFLPVATLQAEPRVVTSV